MGRRVVELAIATGIAPSVWADEGERAIDTAVTVLKEQEREAKKKSGKSSG